MQKGFTLVELLAVIAILAIILLVAVPKIIDVLNNVKTSAYSNDENMMKKAAANYLAANQSLIPTTTGDIYVLDLATLESNHFITEITDVANNDCSGYVIAHKKDTGKIDYYPYLECGSTYKSIDEYTTSGLVFQLDGFDAPVGGNWEDRIGSNNGVITGATYLANKKAYSFNGSNYVSINNPIPTQTPATQDWAVEAVVRVDSRYKSDNDVLLSGWNNSNELSHGTSNRLLLYLNSGTYDYYDYGYYDISNDQLQHVVFNFQYSTDLIEIFINNVDYSVNGARSSSRIPFGISSTVRIGTTLEGEIYSLRIYNRHLTHEEISHNYNIDKQKYGL